MILEMIFEAFMDLVTALDTALIPTLPSSWQNVWNSLLTYIGDGFRFIAVTFDVGLIRQLVQWWILFASMVLAIEIAYGIWKKITGNAGREAESTSTTFNSDGEVISTRVSHSRNKPRLPR